MLKAKRLSLVLGIEFLGQHQKQQKKTFFFVETRNLFCSFPSFLSKIIFFFSLLTHFTDMRERREVILDSR